MNSRDKFGSRIGIIATAAGSAIGLGNIWKFPYMTGQFGGGVFIFVYILAAIFMGYPLVYCEFALGRHAKSNVVDTFNKITGRVEWEIVGYICLFSVYLITTFYMMITGWIIYYFWNSVTGNLYDIPEQVAVSTYFQDVFTTMSTSVWKPLVCSLIAIVVTGFINAQGIQQGVEKYSKIMMPILFVLFIILIGYSMTLPGFKTAFTFLFKPDFNKINPLMIISAIGQAFFSFSIGLGGVLTYGSYISNKENLRFLSFQVCLADTIIALFAGFLVFPAVFTYNLEPTAGPSLVFISLPQVFYTMPGGQTFSIAFFLLIIVAAITSMVSMLEIMITFVYERTSFSRQLSAWFVVLICSIGGTINILGEGPLSFLSIKNNTIFGMLDYLTNNITIPIAAMLTAIVATWIWKTKNLNRELSIGGNNPGYIDQLTNAFLKWIIPPVIVLLMISLIFV